MAVTAKEAFWREHQDSLIRIRSQLSTHGKNSPANRKSPLVQAKRRPASNPTHPPLGKYRRTPPPYLPRVSSPAETGHRTPPLRGNKYNAVPPVNPKPAFVSRPKPDYDSWGEESDDDDDDDRGKRLGLYKPKPYPQPSPMMMGAPFSMYYPPPPKGGRKGRDKGRGYRDLHRDRQNYYRQSTPAMPNRRGKRSKKAQGRGAQSMPFFMPMMPMMMPVDGKYKYIYGEEEDSSDDEEMSYDHPLYLPTHYSCEDVTFDTVNELVEDIVREVASDMADSYLDNGRPQVDPLDDFLSRLMEDVVDGGVREVVRASVLDMAQTHLTDETAGAIYKDIFNQELQAAIPDMLDEVLWDLAAEDFIAREVVAPEVEEEARAVATETLQHYDNKVTRRELQEVTKKANGQLADSLLMEYMLSVIAHQGKIWAQDDYYERYLDDVILTVSMEQFFEVQRERDKTLDNKPLRKLHEKAFMEVALDVSLQQLTASLDEDLADVDQYEQGIMDTAPHPIPLSHSN